MTMGKRRHTGIENSFEIERRIFRAGVDGKGANLGNLLPTGRLPVSGGDGEQPHFSEGLENSPIRRFSRGALGQSGKRVNVPNRLGGQLTQWLPVDDKAAE